MELKNTWSRVFRVWWGLAWRALLVLALFYLVALVVAFVVGGVLFFLQIPTTKIQMIGSEMGRIVLYLSLFPVTFLPLWMILGENVGGFRVVLVAQPEQLAGAADSSVK
ncbi:MAG: hypothetical protein ACLPJH_00215 [Myxococcaceae bacterium]